MCDHARYPDQSKYLDLTPIKRSVARCHEVMNVWRYEEWAGNLRMSRGTGTVPERVQSRVHTTEPTGPVAEPFHCDHIARWSARCRTTGRSGKGVNTSTRLRSGTVPVPKLWCEHGLSYGSKESKSSSRDFNNNDDDDDDNNNNLFRQSNVHVSYRRCMSATLIWTPQSIAGGCQSSEMAALLN